MKYLLIILCVFMASCSAKKKMMKAVNDYGIKETAAWITLERPEVFRPTTVHFKDTIRDTILVTVPEVTHDTTYLPLEPCTLDYLDKRLRFTVKEGNVSYKIFEREQLTFFEYKIDTVFESQPCPEEIVLNELREEILKKETEIAKAKSKSWFQQLRDIFFYVVLAGGFVYGYMKIKPF